MISTSACDRGREWQSGISSARSLGRHNSGDARDGERIAFGIVGQRVEHLAAHAHESMGAGRPARGAFFTDIHHARLAGRIEMGEFAHFRSTGIKSPAAYSGLVRVGHQKRVGPADRGHVARSLPVHRCDLGATDARRKKTGQAGFVAEWPREPGQGERQGSIVGAGQQVQRRAREQLEGHHGGRGIAGQAEEKLAAALCRKPAAGPAESAPGRNRTRAPQSASAASTKSYFPAETPPESSSRSASSPWRDQPRGGFFVVARHRQNHGFAARAPDLGGQRIAVRIPDLMRRRSLSTPTISSPVARIATRGVA